MKFLSLIFGGIFGGIFGSVFGGNGSSKLPQRMREDIKHRQSRSEQIIGWLQLFIIFTFLVLYFLSPVPENLTQEARYMLLEFVPLAMIGYLIFTVFRLFLSYKEYLPGWFLVLSCALDIALLYLIIWSFFGAYGQPPSFVLKIPTILYVFIFITLRALRFDHLYVIITGVFAAVGWLIVVKNVLDIEGMGVITRDYVQYMTSNKVLIGAEFDKVISILTVTGILAVASVRSRNLLFRAVEDNFARTDMSRFFTQDVAEKIVGSGGFLSSGSGERLSSSVMNVDIRGFTKLSSRLSADDLMGLLSEYQGRVVPIIESYSGNIDKFMGDGIMATFGTGSDRVGFARQALLCVGEILSAVDGMSAGGEPLRIGVAVASGELIYGVIGSADRLEYTSIGEPVNLSAKLEKYNSDNGTLGVCDLATITLAREQGLSDDFVYDVRRGAKVVGVVEPMDVVVLA